MKALWVIFLTVIVFEIENCQRWGNTIDFEVDNTNLSIVIFWSCSFLGFVSPCKELRASCHFTRACSQRAERTQVLHSVVWWGQKSSENQKKVGVCAGDGLDRGHKSSLCQNPLLNCARPCLGTGELSFLPANIGSLTGSQGGRCFIPFVLVLFCVKGTWHCRRMKEDESSG